MIDRVPPALRLLAKHPLDGRPDELGVHADPPVFQVTWEMEWMLAVYKELNPRRILEVGSFYGGTLKEWMQAAQPGAEFVCVDLPQWGAHNAARWQAWAAEGGHTLTIHPGLSTTPAIVEAVYDRGPYDFIFIDADHGEPAVRADWHTYSPMIATGGIIALHDINPRDGYGVSALWRDLQQQGHLTMEINAGAAHLCGIGLVFL